MKTIDTVGHAPGEWRVNQVGHAGCIIEAPGRCVAELRLAHMATTQGGIATLQELDANARLIAAAPELLSIAVRLSRLCPSNEGLGGHAPIGAFLQLGEAARAIIAKATQP